MKRVGVLQDHIFQSFAPPASVGGATSVIPALSCLTWSCLLLQQLRQRTAMLALALIRSTVYPHECIATNWRVLIGHTRIDVMQGNAHVLGPGPVSAVLRDDVHRLLLPLAEDGGLLPASGLRPHHVNALATDPASTSCADGSCNACLA